MLHIDVIDTGVGLNDEEIAALFQPFHQIGTLQGRGAGGTGLGLAISRRLAEALSGSISLMSKSGVGSTFRLSIPAAEAGRLATDDRPPAGPPLPSSGRSRGL